MAHYEIRTTASALRAHFDLFVRRGAVTKHMVLPAHPLERVIDRIADELAGFENGDTVEVDSERFVGPTAALGYLTGLNCG